MQEVTTKIQEQGRLQSSQATLIRLIYAEITFREINFWVELFSRMPKSKFFEWIYFCG